MSDTDVKTALDDAFAAAFAEAATGTPSEKPAETPVETADVAASQTEAAEADVADDADAGADDGAGSDNAGGVSAEAETQAPIEQTKETPERDELLKKFADLLERQQAQQPAQQQEYQPETPPALFTEEETNLLQEVEKDFPDIAKAFRVQQRAGNQLLAQYIFNQVADYLKPQIELINEVATRVHESQVRQMIPDYDQTAQKIVEWATSDSQPKILRTQYERVIREGDAEELRELYRLYEQSAQPAQPAKAAPARRAELPATAKKAAALLAPVSSKRSDSQVVPDDALDFDAAFDRFKSAQS